MCLAFVPTTSSAEVQVEFSTVARSGSTSIPSGSGRFNGFGLYPAVDDDGNVVFVGTGPNDASGNFQSGVYTAVGTCCQKVADRNTPIPGGGGATFYVFGGSERNDIDRGRVAFTARLGQYTLDHGLYSNVGQSSAGSLAEVLLVDDVEWDSKGDPYIDAGTVSVRGKMLYPQQETTIMVWDGATGARDYVNPGSGYIVTANTQAPLSGDAVGFRRYKSGSSEMGVSLGGVYDPLAILGVTTVPGLGGTKFKFFRDFPVVDRNGLDAAFIGSDGTIQGVFKRLNGGSLGNVADTATVMPGTTAIPGMGDQYFNLFSEDTLSIANGYVAFKGLGPNSLQGIYTDVGGSVDVIVDTDENNTIVVDGQTRQVTTLSMGPKSFAYTPDGYMVVFKASYSTGEAVIVRAVVKDSGSSTLPPALDTFTVYKDFSDNNTNWVSVNLSCSSGTVTNSPQWAREGTPAVFDIEGASPGATCTASEGQAPADYSKNESDCQDGDPLNGNCTIVNTLNQRNDSFTVYKDFSDNNTAWVSVSLSCSSGTVTNSPQWAREGTPAVFDIQGGTTGTTCTASESQGPSGYTGDESDCRDGDPLNGRCTIVNTLNPTTDSFTVYKDFSDNNTAWVSVSLSCTSGTVKNSPQSAREGVPAVFTIENAQAGTKCTASEGSAPANYSKDESDCQDGDPLNGGCTIVNTLNASTSAQFTVYKDFTDDNASWVYIRLSCTSGSVTNSPRWGREGTPVVFDIEGASAGAKCTAEEISWPDGYAKNESDCQDGDPLNGSCTLVNSPESASSDQFMVYADFTDNSSDLVSVSVSCSSGTVTNNPQSAAEGAPAVFEVLGAATGATCMAMEVAAPAGYSTDKSDCQDGDPVGSSCTVVNTPTSSSKSFTVFKDFSDGNAASVSISLTCTSGTVTNSPQLASEGSPAVFDISGPQAQATCTAKENAVPTGYSANEADCQDGDPVNGSCTIVNTLNAPPPPDDDVIMGAGFESGSAEGWTLESGARLDSSVAIGQHSLLLENGGAKAVRSVSTVGFGNVSVTMHLASDSLEKSDNCYAELSTNGGGSWTTVVGLAESTKGTFISGSAAPASASDNANLMLRFRLLGKGKGDYCWGDEVVVQGTPLGGGTAADKAGTVALDALRTGGSGLGWITGEPAGSDPYGSRGFDPGFDNLVGDGSVQRRSLGYRALISGQLGAAGLSRRDFAVPAGAVRAARLFEGTLELRSSDSASPNVLPGFGFEFVQIGSHLFPVGQRASGPGDTGIEYVIDTGRVWSEGGDNGYSRASIPFLVLRNGGRCVQDASLSFLFREDGSTSHAAFRLFAAAECGTEANGQQGVLEAVYTPGSTGSHAIEIESALACAADAWLPQVQGAGGITVMLMPDAGMQYRLDFSDSSVWLDSQEGADVLRSMCE